MPWQFYPLPFLMRLIFLLRARVTRANGCFELEHPRCQGLRDSHMRDDVRRDVVVRTDANENSDTLRDFRYLSVFDRAQEGSVDLSFCRYLAQRIRNSLFGLERALKVRVSPPATRRWDCRQILKVVVCKSSNIVRIDVSRADVEIKNGRNFLFEKTLPGERLAAGKLLLVYLMRPAQR